MKFILSLFVLVSLSAWADTPMKSFSIDVKEVGAAQVLVEDLGEPVGAPERLTVNITCKKSGEKRQVALYRMCKFKDFVYEKGTKSLTVNLISARVVRNSGDVICDQNDPKQLELSKACD